MGAPTTSPAAELEAHLQKALRLLAVDDVVQAAAVMQQMEAVVRAQPELTPEEHRRLQTLHAELQRVAVARRQSLKQELGQTGKASKASMAYGRKRKRPTGLAALFTQ